MHKLYKCKIKVTVDSSGKQFEIEDVFTSDHARGEELKEFYSNNLVWNSPQYDFEISNFQYAGKIKDKILSNEKGDIDAQFIENKKLIAELEALEAVQENDLNALGKSQNDIRKIYKNNRADMHANKLEKNRIKYALKKIPEKCETVEQQINKKVLLERLERINLSRKEYKNVGAELRAKSIEIAGNRGGVRKKRKHERDDQKTKEINKKVKSISPDIFSKVDEIRQKLENQRMREIEKERKASQAAERHKLAKITKSTTKFKAPTLKMK